MGDPLNNYVQKVVFYTHYFLSIYLLFLAVYIGLSLYKHCRCHPSNALNQIVKLGRSNMIVFYVEATSDLTPS